MGPKLSAETDYLEDLLKSSPSQIMAREPPPVFLDGHERHGVQAST